MSTISWTISDYSLYYSASPGIYSHSIRDLPTPFIIIGDGSEESSSNIWWVNGNLLTNPNDITYEHDASFAKNLSSANYTPTCKAIKEQDERKPIDFESDNNEVYKKPFNKEI